MTTITIRKKLTDYINIADDKKVKAIYTLLENEIEEEEYDKWNDQNFVTEMSRSKQEYKNGSAKLYTFDEVERRARQALKKFEGK